MTSTASNIEMNLEGELNGRPFSIRSDGRRTIVEVPDVATGLGLARLGSPRGLSFQTLRKTKKLLDATDQQVEFQVGGRRVASIGHRPAFVGWRLLGLPTLSLNPVSLIKHFASRTRG